MPSAAFLILSLRYEAAKLGVAVVETVPLAAFADGMLACLAAGEPAINYGNAETRG